MTTGAYASRGTIEVPATLPFRRDAETAFPLGGVLLLIVLLGVAAWAWWTARRRGLAPAEPSWLGGWKLPFDAPRGGRTLRVVDTARLDAGGRLHVVEWRQRRYLLAVSASGAPIVVDREEPPHPPGTGTT